MPSDDLDQMTMIKYLIWDLDGTLFDTYPAFTDAFLAALNFFFR